MNAKSDSALRTLKDGSEPECISYLIETGADPSMMFLNSYERWMLKSSVDWKDPESAAAHIADLGSEFILREGFINRYGFAILWSGAIEAMRPYAPLVEIGAGSGYWTYELQKHGIDCIATDTLEGTYGFFVGENRTEKRWDKSYVEIEKLNSVEAVRKYPRRNILTVWPDYQDTWAADALDLFTGQVVIYMGEGYGNATADDRFHELLDSRFADQDRIPMPHFEYSYDRELLICKKPMQLTKGKTQ